MPPERLTVERLSGGYGRSLVLHDVSFTADASRLVAIIGPNGAGKSTLVKMLCGQIAPSSGRITIDGTPLVARRERRHLVGLVPQNIGLYPHLTGRENLSVFAKLLHLDADVRSERVSRALDLVGMNDRADIRVEQMSGGMQRRINVAVATLSSPPVIIFDEPTAGVDQPARDTIHRLARKLSGEGHTVLIVTHELEQAESVCDDLLVLEKGRVRSFGSPADILKGAFGEQHEVVIRLKGDPSERVSEQLHRLGFHKELTSKGVFLARTTDGNPSFITRLMTSLGDSRNLVREVAVRKPGLATLMSELKSR